MTRFYTQSRGRKRQREDTDKAAKSGWLCSLLWGQISVACDYLAASYLRPHCSSAHPFDSHFNLVFYVHLMQTGELSLGAHTWIMFEPPCYSTHHNYSFVVVPPHPLLSPQNNIAPFAEHLKNATESTVFTF